MNQHLPKSPKLLEVKNHQNHSPVTSTSICELVLKMGRLPQVQQRQVWLSLWWAQFGAILGRKVSIHISLYLIIIYSVYIYIYIHLDSFRVFYSQVPITKFKITQRTGWKCPRFQNGNSIPKWNGPRSIAWSASPKERRAKDPRS